MGRLCGLVSSPNLPQALPSPLWKARRWLCLAPFPLGMPRAGALCVSCRYFEDLVQLKGQCRAAGEEFLSWNSIQDSVNATNSSVQDENERERCPRWGEQGLCMGSPALGTQQRVSPCGGGGADPCIPSFHAGITAVRLINEALLQQDPEKTLSALLLQAAALPHVSLPIAQRYHHVLAHARRMKAQVGGDPLGCVVPPQQQLPPHGVGRAEGAG